MATPPVWPEPLLQLGEDAVFFLETLGNGRTTTVGLSQGSSPPGWIHSQEGRDPIRSPREPDVRSPLHPLPKGDERVFLDDFVDRIQTRVEQGWDGKAIPGVGMGASAPSTPSRCPR